MVVLLAPIVPHFCEEIWAEMGHGESILLTPWPEYREDALVKDDLIIVIQVNGKVRSRIQIPQEASEGEIEQKALEEALGTYLNDVMVIDFVVNR